jgi:predicted alpha/beta hydrolase
MLTAVEHAQEYLDRGTDRLGLQVYPVPADAVANVVVWPAMGTPARYYRPFAAALGAAGLAVAVADLRGTGTSTPPPTRRSRYGYPQLAADVAAVHDALKPRFAGRPTVLLGHSLGGQVCTLALAHGGVDVAGLALVAVGLPYWRSYGPRRGARLLGYTQGLAATAAVLGVWPGWGFGGRQAHLVMADWAYTARTGRFATRDGFDAEAALAAVTVPVLAVSVDDDRYTPPACTDHLVGKLTAAPVERVHYTRAEAGGALDHFRWTRAGTALAARVATFAVGRSTR